LPFYERHRFIEPVLIGVHNKPKAEVHLGHMLTGPKEEEQEQEEGRTYKEVEFVSLNLASTFT
jgi:hypothetical protein